MSTEISRIKLVLNRTFQVVALYVLQKYVVDAVFPYAFSPISTQEFTPRQEIYFWRLLLLQVTLRETLMRTVLAFQWIWMNVLGLHSAQTTVAILFSIILRWDEPYEWPPLFGNPLDAWNLRRFWASSGIRSFTGHTLPMDCGSAFALHCARVVPGEGICGMFCLLAIWPGTLPGHLAFRWLWFLTRHLLVFDECRRSSD